MLGEVETVEGFLPPVVPPEGTGVTWLLSVVCRDPVALQIRPVRSPLCTGTNPKSGGDTPSYSGSASTRKDETLRGSPGHPDKKKGQEQIDKLLDRTRVDTYMCTCVSHVCTYV